MSSPASHALAVSEQAQPSSAEAATQTDIAQDTREGNALQQQDVQELHDGARRGEAEAEMLKEELQRSEARVQQQDQELSELREELSRLKAAAAAVPAPAPGPGPGPGLERGEAALESPPETRRGDAAPEGPTTPETASSEGPSRGTDRSAPDRCYSKSMTILPWSILDFYHIGQTSHQALTAQLLEYLTCMNSICRVNLEGFLLCQQACSLHQG